MSLVELKERLALLKKAQQAEQQEKREHIFEEKQNKKQLLLEQLDAINLHRRALAHAAAIRSGKMFCSDLIIVIGKHGLKQNTYMKNTTVMHVIMIDLVQCRKEERNARLHLQQTVTQDETVLALQRKLEEKQLERQRLKQTESKKVKNR